jgi:hypothetical protein
MEVAQTILDHGPPPPEAFEMSLDGGSGWRCNRSIESIESIELIEPHVSHVVRAALNGMESGCHCLWYNGDSQGKRQKEAIDDFTRSPSGCRLMADG